MNITIRNLTIDPLTVIIIHQIHPKFLVNVININHLQNIIIIKENQIN